MLGIDANASCVLHTYVSLAVLMIAVMNIHFQVNIKCSEDKENGVASNGSNDNTRMNTEKEAKTSSE